MTAPYSPGDPIVSTGYAYDALGRTVAITNTDGTARSFDYSSWDQVTITDENGHQTRRISDGLDRLRQVELFTTGEFGLTFYARTTYTYDPKDDLRQVHHFDDSGSEIAKPVLITTNSLGQKVEMDDPDMGLWRYSYDAAGNLATQTDARGQTLTFGYDELNRLTGKTYSDGTPPVSYSYDEGQFGKGQRTAMADESGSTAWAYDALGRLLAETQTITGAGTYTTTYTYDRLDRVQTMTYPDGEVVTYTYNAQNLVDSLASSLGQTYLSNMDYNALDQPTQMSLGNGVTTTYGYYDDPGSGPAHFRLHTLQTSGPGGSPLLQDLTYQYDNVGNVSAIADAVTGADWSYGYDALDRLTSASRLVSGGEGGSDSFSYSYDRLHNLTYRYDPINGQSLTLTYPNSPTAPRPHAPLSVTDGESTLAGFNYDANGNREADTQRGITYDFDIENRLVQVNDSAQATFVYDGSDRRVKRTVDDGSEVETTIYVGEHFETTAGDRWGTPQLIFGASGDQQWWPDVVSDDAGRLYLVWLEAEFVGGDYFGQLHFARYDPLGQAWTSPETIPTSEQQFAGEDDGILPTIAVAPNGEVYVAWQEFVGSSNGIWVYRRDTNGAWSQDFSSNQLYTETKPSLTAAPDGTIYLAWQNEDDGTIQIRRRDTNGAWTSEPAIPQSSGYAAQYPALAADSQSNIFLVYDQQFDLHLTRREAASGTWGIDPNLGNPSGGEAEVAVGPDDSLYIIWAAGARRRDAAGTWEDLGDSVNVLYGFDLTVDPFGQYHKIEDDPSDTSGDDLQIWVDGMGILPDPSGGRSSIINPYYPTMAVGEAGNLTAIWQAQPTQDDPARLYISVNQPQVTKHYYTSGGNQRIATRVAGQVYYIHGDHLGSTTLLTDDSGNEVSRVQYSPYGAIIEQSGSLPTDRLFTGQRFEAGLELYDYRARFYDPLTANFISPDTIVPQPERPGDWNRFAHVRGNPVRYTDPSGHCVVQYSGDVRMGQAPYGTSGVCPHTESVAIEGAYAATQVANIPGYGNDPTRGPAIAGLFCILGGCLEVIPYAISAIETAIPIGTAACADGDCTNEARTVAQTAQRARVVYDPSLPWGISGDTDKLGNIIRLNPNLPRLVRLQTLYHEQVHAFFSPRGPFRTIRAEWSYQAYRRSHLLRYLEEAIAESRAQVLTGGSLKEGLTYPIKYNYVQTSNVLREVIWLTLDTVGLGYLLGEGIERSIE